MKRRAFYALLLILVAHLVQSELITSTPYWMSVGTYLEYKGDGYLEIAQGEKTCRISSIVSLWLKVQNITQDLAYLSLRLEINPRKIIECPPNISFPLTLETTVKVMLDSREAEVNGKKLGKIPFWIEGIVPNQEVIICNLDNRTLTGRVPDYSTIYRINEDAYYCWNIEVWGPFGTSFLSYDQHTGILLQAYEENWEIMKALGIKSSSIDLVLVDANVGLSRVNPILTILVFTSLRKLVLSLAFGMSIVGTSLILKKQGLKGLKTPKGKFMVLILFFSLLGILLS